MAQQLVIIGLVTVLTVLVVSDGISKRAPNPQVCPPESGAQTSNCAYKKGCDKDSDCGQGQLCCIEQCNKKCKQSVPEFHSGTCPNSTTPANNCENADLSNNCGGDYECQSSQKCCDEGCGMICKDV